MNAKLYLRCIYGGESPIIKFYPDTLLYETLSLNFFKNGVYETKGICSFIKDKKKNLTFIALYEEFEKMFLYVNGIKYDLFDEKYQIVLKRKIFTNKATLFYRSKIIFDIDYKTVAGVDDIFSYAEDVLKNMPRKIVRA